MAHVLEEWKEDHKRLRQIELTLTQLVARLDGLPVQIQDHETRIRAHEKWRENFIGKWSILVALGAGIVAAAIAEIVHKTLH